MDATAKTAVTPEFLEARIKEVEAAADIDEATKAKLTEHYRAALSDLEAARALEVKSAAYAQALEKAPAQAAAIRQKLATGPAAQPAESTELPADASIPDLEGALAKVQADATAVAAKLSEIEKELDAGTRRPAEARQRIEEVKGKLEVLDAERKLPPPEGETRALTNARRWALEAREQALRTEILMLDKELLSQAARTDLLKAERDKAASDLKNLKANASSLEEQLSQRRESLAQSAKAEAEAYRQQAKDKHPLLQDLAQKNAALSEELTTLTEELNHSAGAHTRAEEQTRRIREDLRNARQRVEVAGLTQALGQVLIDQRNQLPDGRVYKKEAAAREKSIADATLQRIRSTEELRRLADLDAYVHAFNLDSIPPEQRESVTQELRELAQRRKVRLEQALHADEAYLSGLEQLDYASSELMKAAAEYDGFLAERLLWVRSTPPITLSAVTSLPGAVAWLIAPRNWLEVAPVLLHEASRSPLLWLLSLVGVGLLWKTRAMRRAIRATHEHLRRVRTDKIRYTLKALGLTLLIAAPWPLLLAVLGWHLYFSVEATDFTKAIGQAGLSLALGVYYLRAFRLLCMPGGVADRHFRWSGDVLSGLRRDFDWMIFVLVPLGFVASVLYNHHNTAFSGSLGRLSLIALLVGLAMFFARVLHPGRGALHNLLAEHPDGWLNRLRRFWYPFAVAAPVALAMLTFAGYVYTAATLLTSLVSSMYLVLVLTVVHELIFRWLMLTRRHLALKAALERRAARSSEETQGEREGGGVLKVEEPKVDLASLDEQTRKLVNALITIGFLAGLWALWSDVLPAFGIFEEIALWHYSGLVNGQEKIIPVTLADIGLVFVITIIATVAVRNLPALLEILLLQRMSLSSGSRYTVKTLTSYLITATAALTVFSTLGLSWGQVQWLVAALGVGIGFGLQEIVANFISGLIILFERPVRVGDIVTIGDTTGAVSRIRIRATTIRNWDKQELLVPNKEFITGRLLNWSLSDQVNRLVITVGVDYGTDIPLALKLLNGAAAEHERVLDDPEPIITFEGFGDNALTLVLRCYLETLDNRLAVVSALHQAINEKFQAAGISIAFPQRDVHLSAGEPLDVRVHQAGPDARPSA